MSFMTRALGNNSLSLNMFGLRLTAMYTIRRRCMRRLHESYSAYECHDLYLLTYVAIARLHLESDWHLLFHYILVTKQSESKIEEKF